MKNLRVSTYFSPDEMADLENNMKINNFKIKSQYIKWVLANYHRQQQTLRMMGAQETGR